MTKNTLVYPSIQEAQLPSLCSALQKCWAPRSYVIYLHGILGAGKTTWVRAYLAQLGYTGRVKSPTYSLVEMYSIGDTGLQVAHFDLYRLQSEDELYYLGIEDIIAEHQIIFIEWPEKGGLYTPEADAHITLSWVSPESRDIEIMSKALPLPPTGSQGL